MSLLDTLESMIFSLKKGETPNVSPEEFACFTAEALASNPMIPEDAFAAVMESLDERDVPTLERAVKAVKSGEQAWLGFKIVLDAGACEVDAETGTVDNRPGVFFETQRGQATSSREFTHRDKFQMDDITKGPSVHAGQFPGLVWASVPLFEKIRVMVFGGGDVSRFIARYAMDCGFDVLVFDDDEGFLGNGRFDGIPTQLIDFAKIAEVEIPAEDYAVVVTRNHTFDAETLARVVECHPAYMGMIGHVDKIAMNFDQVRAGASVADMEAVLKEVHAPIGLKCGAMTPAEIAISIVAELVKTRHDAIKARLAELEG